MKKIVSVLMLVFALFLGGCGNGGLDVTNDDYKFDSLQTQINASNARIDELVAQVNALAAAASDSVTQAQVNELQNQITILTNQLSALQTQVGTDNITITAEIKGLTDRIVLLEGTVALLQAKVDGQAVQIADLITQIGLLNDRIDELVLRVTILEQDVPCEEGSIVYTGAGDPEFRANNGDLYFDTRSGSDHKHSVWIYKSGHWSYYGQIVK